MSITLRIYSINWILFCFYIINTIVVDIVGDKKIRNIITQQKSASISLFESPLKRIKKGRTKRQVIYHICGRYPYQFYSTTQCPRCVNNGQDLNAECTSVVQCATLYGSATACVNGRCCTADDSGIIDGVFPQYEPTLPDGPPGFLANLPSSLLPPSPYEPFDPTFGTSSSITYGFCSQGERSNIRCAAAGQCLIQQICLNGLCCPRTANNFAHACGGEMALGICDGGQCANGLTCTPSNFCCACPLGRSGGRCNQGECAPGYVCNFNGFCCAACPDRTTPYGECARERTCGGGARCQPAGDICCSIPPNISTTSLSLTSFAATTTSTSLAAFTIKDVFLILYFYFISHLHAVRTGYNI